MQLEFVKVNPVENMTVFILDEVEKSKHIEIAKKIMSYSNLCAEQVGFVEKMKADDDNIAVRLQMMGGEFCANATRSLAALLVHYEHKSIKNIGNNYYVDVEASGLEKNLRCTVQKTGDFTYMSKVALPLPSEIPTELLLEDKFKLYRVDFDGISHFIIDIKTVNDKDYIFKLIKYYMEGEDYEAFGIMFYDFDIDYLTPLVYVKATDSLFWERSCASGTSAIGSTLSYIYSKEVDLDVSQPGGILNIQTRLKYGVISDISLKGKVEIVARGIVNI